MRSRLTFPFRAVALLGCLIALAPHTAPAADSPKATPSPVPRVIANQTRTAPSPAATHATKTIVLKGQKILQN